MTRQLRCVMLRGVQRSRIASVLALVLLWLLWLLWTVPTYAQDTTAGADDWEDEFDQEEPAPVPPAVATTPRSDDWESEFDDPEPLPEPQPTTPSTASTASGDASFSDDGFDEEATSTASAADAPERVDHVTVEETVRSEGHTRDSDPAWNRLFANHLTYGGAVGGIHVVDAGSAAVGSMRLQLSSDFFYTSDFLVEGDSHSHIGGAFAINYTLHRMVEVWAQLSAFSNANDFENPGLFQVIGDLELGAKVFHSFSDLLRVGGDVTFKVLNGVGDVGLAFRSTTIGLRANVTADFRGLSSPIPLLARLNLGYVFDNSSNLIHGIESQRYERLPDAATEALETRHLLSAVERFGLGVNRTDFFNIGIGFEAPIVISDSIRVSPMLEWNLGIPVNRQGYDCFYLPGPDGGEPTVGDSCLQREGFNAFPSRLSLGVRVQPAVRGLSLFAGADMGLTGTSPTDAVRELSATEPYKIMLALSYAFDVRSPEPRVIVRETIHHIEIPAEEPARGHINGLVVSSAEDAAPIAGATIRFAGQDTAQMTDADGRFRSFPLPPGEVAMTVRHPEFANGQCAATLGADAEDGSVRCVLDPALVVVEENEIQILEKIHFATAQAEILPESFPLMGQIAQTLVDHPELTRIEIQGHTDDIGTLDYNQGLSQDRADSVRTWLIEHQVDAGRLTAHGYSYSRPLVPNTSDETRAQNRRVQFVIEAHAEATAPGIDQSTSVTSAP